MHSKPRIPRKFLIPAAFGMTTGLFPELFSGLILGVLSSLPGEVPLEKTFHFPTISRLEALEAEEAEKIRQDSSPDSLFLEELLKRGLFRLAELHCRERLALRSISPAVQTEMTLELIRVLQEQALCAPMPEKKELDAQSQRLYEDFLKAHPECPWRPALDFQYAVGIFAQARRAEMEARFALDPQAGMEEARARLRDAIRLFLEIDAQREKQVLALAQEGTVGTPSSLAARKKRTRNSAAESARTASRFDGDGLSLWELESLRQNLEFQLLLAYQLQALTYPPDSLDRINALKEAQSRTRSLTMIPSGSALYWNARIEEIRCFRLVNDLENAQKRLEMLDSQRSTMPEATRLELLAEQIRFALAKEDLPLALETVRTELHADILGRNGELDCAILELWLAQWDDAMKKGDTTAETSVHPGSASSESAPSGSGASEKEKASAQKLRDESLEILNAIRAKSAPWWVLRAEILFNGMLKNAGENQNLSFLKLAAENACVNFDPDAVIACERLWKAAVSQKETETALHAAEMAGTLLYRNGKKADSVTWFRRMAVTFPEDANAVQNHSRAASILAECVSQELNASEGKLNETLNARLDAYQLLLMEHFQLFGKKDPQYLERLRQLENVTRIRQNYAECVDVSMILAANTPPEAPNYRETVDSCFQTWRLYLEMLEQNAATDYPQALFSAIQWSRTLPGSEVHSMEMVPFLLRLNRLHARLAQKQTSDMELPDASKKALQKQIVQKEIQLFDSMKPHLDTFPPEIRDEVEQIGAHALLHSGKRQEAFPFYEQIAGKFPNRLEVQLTWGRLLAENTEKNEAAEKEKTAEVRQKALDQWRRIEKHVPDRSSEWFEAKYWIIRLQWELGEEKLAARLFRTFRILHPDFGGKEWKKKFEELEEKMKIS